MAEKERAAPCARGDLDAREAPRPRRVRTSAPRDGAQMATEGKQITKSPFIVNKVSSETGGLLWSTRPSWLHFTIVAGR